MNERIRQFEKQCWNHQANCLDAERFAELIVRECTKILADNSEFRGCVIIGKHFRVEE